MTDSIDTPDASADKPARKGGGLSSKLLPELKQIAGGLGIRTNGLKKAELVSAIQQAQSQDQGQGQKQGQEGQEPRQQKQKQPDKQKHKDQPDQPKQQDQQDKQKHKDQSDQQKQQKQQDRPDQQKQQDQAKQPDKQPDKAAQQNQGQSDDEEGGSRRNRRRRGRDRANAQGGQQGQQGQQGQGGGRGRNEPDLTVLDDDVLAPCAGILDVLDNYAFVRTSGYLHGTEDVYVSMSMVRKFGLRRGDAIVGQVRQPREGERREKFNPLVQIDSVNGGEPEAAKERVDFADLTPVHPSERLRLETSRDNLTGRVVDLVAPIGKGQRGLILAPAKSGRTELLKSMAASVTTTSPGAHLMVVLVDERPEEVTDFQRTVRGEVIGSTFDRPAADHVTAAELAIERAKRLVELGHDVVVLLDGITRLARAYNLVAPTGGRLLAGGFDASALHPAKRLLGAARALENGGSLTILATATVDSSSQIDEVILEEIADTANWELRLRREYAAHGLVPPVDPQASGTRHQELLMSPEELAILAKLTRTWGEGEDALRVLVDEVRGSQNNIELLTKVKQRG